MGLGELLARLEKLKKLLAAEGLFDRARKRRLPFLPGRIGLITGRASAAERDVLTNARRRWPAVEFRTVNVAVQGPTAVPQIIDALEVLDADESVDVIVIARGGGGIEDLLPFSDEALCRAVFACRTPVVSAIGHETDAPLLDYVADVRASTPTDAAKRIVPDLAEEVRAHRPGPAAGWNGRSATWSTGSSTGSTLLRSRPVLARPQVMVDQRAAERGRAARSAPAAAWSTGSARPATTCGTPWPGCARSPPPRPWSAGTRSCSAPTATWSARPPRWPRATRCGSGSPRASWPRPWTAEWRPATGERCAEMDATTDDTKAGPTSGSATSRPAPSWPRWSSGWRPAAPHWRSRWRSGSAASGWPTICQRWLDGARARIDAARQARRVLSRPTGLGHGAGRSRPAPRTTVS